MKFFAISASILAIMMLRRQEVQGGALNHFVKRENSFTGIQLSCSTSGPALDKTINDFECRKDNVSTGDKPTCSNNGKKSEEFSGTISCPSGSSLYANPSECKGGEIYCKNGGETTGVKSPEPNFDVSCSSNGTALATPVVQCGDSGVKATCVGGEDDKEFKGKITCGTGDPKVMSEGKDACPGKTPTCKKKTRTETKKQSFEIRCGDNTRITPGLIAKCSKVPSGQKDEAQCVNGKIKCNGMGVVSFTNSEGKTQKDPPCGKGGIVQCEMSKKESQQ